MTSKTTAIDVDQIKQTIYDEWQSPEIVAAYRKWDRIEREWGSAANDLLIRGAQLSPGMTVLDLASGHGEPALALAEVVRPGGHVTATDQGPALLTLAEEEARRRGLTNMTFRVADAHALPFPDGTFDRVTSRLGIMYFVELERALAEVRRVLKPDGRATFLAWGPFEQPFFETMLGGIFQHITPPEPAPDEPHPFIFAERGSLTAALQHAGFRSVEEEHARVPTTFTGTPRQYWDWFWEMAPPIQPLLEALPSAQREQVIEQALAALQPFVEEDHVVLPIQVVLASGQR